MRAFCSQGLLEGFLKALYRGINICVEGFVGAIFEVDRANVSELLVLLVSQSSTESVEGLNERCRSSSIQDCGRSVRLRCGVCNIPLYSRIWWAFVLYRHYRTDI